MDHDLREPAGVEAACGRDLTVADANERTAVLEIATLLVVHTLGLAPSGAGQAGVTEPFGSTEGGGLGLLSGPQGKRLTGGVVEHGLLTSGVELALTLVVPILVVPSIVLGLGSLGGLRGFLGLSGGVIGAFEASDEVLLVPRNGKVALLEQLLELRDGHAAEIVGHLDHSLATR